MKGHLSYADAMAALKRALVFGVNPSLEGVTDLVEELGRPQDRFRSVQITGTNGKTSTARITAALLRAEGYHVGLYTSPQLERYPERMEIDGAVVSDADFALAIEAAVRAADRLRGESSIGTPSGFTEFELLTAGALWLFAERGVDFVVLEVGMGGRWDATSVVAPAVAVITGVGLDHTAILGGTVEEIAADKAAIIKPGSAAVLGPGTVGLEPIFLARAAEVGARGVYAVREDGSGRPPASAAPADTDTETELPNAAKPSGATRSVTFEVTRRPSRPGGSIEVRVRGLFAEYPALTLPGPSYQAPNIATGVAAVEAALGRALSLAPARTALAALRIPGRFELVRSDPPVIIDGSHNPQAAEVLAGAVREAFAAEKPRLLLGILADKDAEGIVRALAPVADGIFVTQSASSRALAAEKLAEIVERVTGAPPTGTYDTVADALSALSAMERRAVLVTGSITIAGEARGILRGDEAAR
ncbi:MAG: bifunctional folylpolyglutamate synthase/dihydrofolate synthase [Coriobacteriia bacterium]